MSGIVQQFEVSRLNVEVFDEGLARYRAIVSEVSLALSAGQGLGITGESGSGKTTLSLALSGLLPQGFQVSAEMFRLQVTSRRAGTSGSDAVVLGGARHLDMQFLKRLRGRHLFMLFQEPRASLNPYRTIGWQLKRCARHRTHDTSLIPRPSPIGTYTSSSPRLRGEGGGEGPPDHRTPDPLPPSPQPSPPADGGRGRIGSDLYRYAAPSALTALAEVGLDADIVRHYPHELSTGMCQRVFLAMASLLGSKILIADEPFASVDMETRGRLTALVRDWMRSRGMALILVSHDLDLLRELTDQVLVMYQGQAAETGPTKDILGRRSTIHPYTWLLRQVSGHHKLESYFSAGFASLKSPAPCCFSPRCAWAEPAVCVEAVPAWRTVPTDEQLTSQSALVAHQVRCVRRPTMETQPDSEVSEADDRDAGPTGGHEILRVRGLAKHFQTGWIRRKTKQVLRDVGFSLHEGERLGIMGPSGQGKTTLARIVMGVLRPSAGCAEIPVAGPVAPGDVSRLSVSEPAQFRRRVQMLYQDSDLVLDPASRVGDALVEAYQVFDPRLGRGAAYRLSAQLLSELALPHSLLEAYPYRLSGGERKRVALARALAAMGCPFAARLDEPWRLLLMDEPTAGVDVFLQAILARFLIWVQPRLRLSYLVFSHDEEFVRRFCHRMLRLENGHVATERAQQPV